MRWSSWERSSPGAGSAARPGLPMELLRLVPSQPRLRRCLIALSWQLHLHFHAFSSSAWRNHRLSTARDGQGCLPGPAVRTTEKHILNQSAGGNMWGPLFESRWLQLADSNKENTVLRFPLLCVWNRTFELVSACRVLATHQYQAEGLRGECSMEKD